jgi:iron(III) transport system ATP-binding protein
LLASCAALSHCRSARVPTARPRTSTRATAIAAPLLAADTVAIRAGHRPLVADLSFTLEPGERLVLTGPNGSGKSTLLRVLAGLSEPASGRITRPAAPPGMLFQDGALWPHLTVEEHLAFVDRGRSPEWRERLLATLRLADLRRARPERLSGGERVRLGLARALAGRPAWLLLDEPLAHLDAFFEDLLRGFLPRCLDELGAAAVLVTHTSDSMALLGTRVLCLSGSGPWWLGDARDALEQPPTPLLAALAGRGTVLSAVADAHGRADFGLGLHLDGRRPGIECWVHLDAAQVQLADAAAPGHGADRAPAGAPLAGVYVGSDGHGGGWVAIDDQLLRCTPGATAPAPGAAVHARLRGAPRVLSLDGRGASA